MLTRSMSVRKQAHLLLQRQRAVDGGEDMAAAGVVLERHAGDMKILAERRERALPVRAITLAHRAPVARLAFQHVQRTGNAFRWRRAPP